MEHSKTLNYRLILFCVVLTLLPSNLWADANNPNTDWFKDARLGVFMHLLPGNANELERVIEFDVDALADQLEKVGAKYFVLTLGQNSGFMNSPNPTYECITGYKAGERCSTRDLPLDLYRALYPKGIKLMLYLPCQAPNGDKRAQEAFGLAQGAKDQSIDVTFAQKWAEVIYDWSARYHDKVAGWWFDGGYEWIGFNNEIAKIYAVKRGNSKAIVTFNPGIKLIHWTDAEDYTAGELNEPLDYVPDSRWIDGSQWHTLTYLGPGWAKREVRYPTEKWSQWAMKVVENSGVITLDTGPNWNPANGPIGTISAMHMDQLRQISAALATIPSGSTKSACTVSSNSNLERNILVSQTKRDAAEVRNSKVGVKLRSRFWRFDTTQTPVGTLNVQNPKAAFAGPSDATTGFSVKLNLNLREPDQDRDILSIPGVLHVSLHLHDPENRDRQNYPAFKMRDGSVPVLEATLTLHSIEHPDWQNMTIGIPLAMLPQPFGEHEVVLHFTGPDWRMYVDGELLDNDFPFGYARWEMMNAWKIDPALVKQATLYFPAIRTELASAKTIRLDSDIQYWTPPGHNNWVGDVETCYYNGRYHVFYLYDRRHHGSKFGCGAHYFEHLSTANFKTWTEHEASTPLEEQWECIGTGVPFILDNQLYISYGLHTTRVYPQEKTALKAQWDYLKQNGRTGAFPRATTPGFPAGSTYSVCTDGIASFKKSGIMFHPCENPSVYIDPDGRLRLLANYRSQGTWESESLDGGWRCVNDEFPPGGDCTIFFRWGRFEYVIGGFSGLWSKPADAPDSAYEDVVRKGMDFYDGSNVPAVTKIVDGRFLMAAWVPVRGWGGALLIRELIQFPDGRIGSKWMKEIMPDVGTTVRLAATLTKPTLFSTDYASFLLEFTVHPGKSGKGGFGISFLPGNGEQAGCELGISLDGLRAQFGPGSLNGQAQRQKSLREGGSPHSARDYAIENLIGVDKPFCMRVMVKSNDKLGGSLIDAEIAGHRTMISYRPDLDVKKLAIRTEGTEISDLSIAPLAVLSNNRLPH